MRVFISSVIHGFEEYRAAALRACQALRHEVKRSEDFAASSASPQQVCLEGVRWAEVVLLLVGGRYGTPQPSGLSATHEEYREARERAPVLAFVQERVEREPAQREFLKEVRAWTAGHTTVSFTDAEELRDAVTAALRDLELSQAVGRVDEQEMLARAQALVPADARSLGVRLSLVVAGGPAQELPARFTARGEAVAHRALLRRTVDRIGRDLHHLVLVEVVTEHLAHEEVGHLLAAVGRHDVRLRHELLQVVE